jgi:UDP:flavonoid glycosyltransferase YjiC (YdhE family)
MRITIVAVGSRGDVQPYLALGAGLRRAGHAVRLAVHAPFAELVAARGLEFHPLAGDPAAALATSQGRRWLATSRDGLGFVVHGVRLLRPLLEQLLADSWAACRDSEAIIFSTLGIAGYHIGERLGVPVIGAALQPFSPTREFPAISISPRRRLGGTLNRLTHRIAYQAIWQLLRSPLNRWRREALGLAPLPLAGPFGRMERERLPLLYGYSEHVVPRPADWPPWLHVTGYWFLDRPHDWTPPADLQAFVAAGLPPVYVGFGSMTHGSGPHVADLAREALCLAGQRGVMLAGDLPAGPQGENLYVVGEVPHDWLFARMAAVVHHGGAGTTAAGLRAGVPAVICPYFGDQPFWAERVSELGAGPAPIPQRRLTAQALAAAIRAAVEDPSLRTGAAALGERLRAEDGVARAVELVERYTLREPVVPGRGAG